MINMTKAAPVRFFVVWTGIEPAMINTKPTNDLSKYRLSELDRPKTHSIDWPNILTATDNCKQ